MKRCSDPINLFGIGAIALVSLLSFPANAGTEATLSEASSDNQELDAPLVLNEIAATEGRAIDWQTTISHQSPKVMNSTSASNEIIAGEEQSSRLELTTAELVSAEPGSLDSQSFDAIAPLISTQDPRLNLHDNRLPFTVSEVIQQEASFQVADRPASALQPLQSDWQEKRDRDLLAQSSEPDRSDWPSPIHDNQVFWMLLVEQLEYRLNDGTDSLNWDAVAWVGGDYQRLWIKTEGEVDVADDGGGEAELQLLYGRLISPFWDVQAGLRYDQAFGPDGAPGRAFAVIGIHGLTPYQFEVDASLFVSHEGDVSARFEAEYKLLLTQRLILQPDLEINIAAQQVEEFGVGSGLNDIELGLRLRYEVSRQFAPYVGISWTRKFGQTAEFAREEGKSTDNLAVVGGIRLLF